MNNAVWYRDGLLARNSEAYFLWEVKEFKKLDAHLKDLDRKQKELIERYDQQKQPSTL